MNQLYEWYEIQQHLVALKARELELRNALFTHYFPEPVEGTQKVEIPGDAVLVASLPYSYTLDVEKLEEGLAHIPTTKQEKLISWKPSLSKAAYNTLTKKSRDAFTAVCVTVKPGTPSLTIRPAKED